MSVLDRSELEASPLADLHAIADQLGLDGFRRLRKADLIDAILGEPSRRWQAGTDQDPRRKEPPTTSPRASSSDRSARDHRRWRFSQTSYSAPAARSEGEAEERAPLRREPRLPLLLLHLFACLGFLYAAVVVAAGASARSSGGRSDRGSAQPNGGPDASPSKAGAEDAHAVLAAPRAWSSCWATARPFCASIRPSPPTMTSTSPPRRSAAASSSPATA